MIQHSKRKHLITRIKKFAGLSLILIGIPSCSLFDTKEILLPSNTVYSVQDWQQASHSLQQVKQWHLMGKINIRTPEDSVTAAINKWTQMDDSFSLDLSSTFFGLGATKLFGSSHFLTIIESGEEPISSDQPDQLIEAALGFSLPISYLSSWIKALPIPHVPYKTEFNEQGLPKMLEQYQWKLEFSKYTFENGVPLPGKIKLQHDNTHIILAIKKWTLL